MGILTSLRAARELTAAAALADVHAALGPDPSTYPIATPWGSAELARIVYEDVFGTDVPANSRSAARK